MPTIERLNPFDNPGLTTPEVLADLERLPPLIRSDAFLIEIDPNRLGGDEFCSDYGIPPESGGNCVVLEARRGDRCWYVAALVPVGYKMDIGGYVRRLVNARKTSVASLEGVLDATGMEYGSITAIGLPEDWTVLVDSRLAGQERVYLGSGRAKSKLCVPGHLFSSSRFTIVDDLGIPRD